MRYVTKSFAHLAIFSLVFNQFVFAFSSTALAQDLPITPDGSTATQVTQTASGIDQVNIATPNSSGLSHNNFTDYNINQSGQVINNFSGQVASEVAGGSGTSAVTSTQIGGLVTVNQNLSNSGSARIILNEVTSGNNTQLLGYGEIAGTKAELIIANPNGITCSGCGFINTSRLSLVAGSSNFDQNNNLGFNLTEQTNPNLTIPLITISGLGLDVERTSATDIIASSIKLIGNIYGSDDTDVTLKTGEGSYNYNTKQLTTDDRQLSTNVELFAVDASNLGSIQSGRIFIIATKDGFGVNLNNSLIASKELNIDAKGNVYYSSISSADKVTIKSTKNIESKNSSAEISSPNLTIKSNAEIKNLGALSAYNLTLLGGGNFTNSGDVETLALDLSNIKDVANSGTIFAQDSLNFSAENFTNSASGKIFSNQNYTLTLSNLLSNSGTIYSSKDLTISTKQLTNSSEISAENNLTITARDSLINSSKILGNGTLTISAKNLTNNSSGAFQSKKDLSITATSLDNYGSIKSFQKSTITTDAITNRANALIFSSGDSNVVANNSLTNSGSILSQAVLNLTAGQTTNDNEIFATGNLNLTLSDSLNNSGSISSFGDFDLQSTSSISNSKELLSGGNLTITATDLTNSNTIQSDKKLTLNLHNLTNSKNILAVGIFAINATGDVTNSSTLQSSDNFTINAASLTNSTSSLILAGKDLTIKSTSIINKNTKPSGTTITSGLVSANGNITLQTDLMNNDSGMVTAKSTNLISFTDGGTVNLSNIAGKFIATSGISLDLGNLDYTITGEINAQNVDITARNITNLGNVTATEYIKFVATGNALNSSNGNITNGQEGANNANVNLQAGSYLTLITNRYLSNYGTISAQTDLTLTSNYSEIFNYGSIKGGNGTTVINATNAGYGIFTNYSGAVLTSNNNLIINSKDINNSGEISVKNDLTANVINNLSNNSTALIWSGRDSKFYVANNFVNDRADIYAERNLTIQKNSSAEKTNLLQNISGNIETYNGDIIIKAASFENKRATDSANSALIVPNGREGKLTGWTKVSQYCGGNNCENWSYVFTASSSSNPNSISGKIISGNNLNIDVGNFKNEVSEIYSKNNGTINFQNTFNNNTLNSVVGNLTYIFVAAWDRDYHEFYDNSRNGARVNIADYIQAFPAYIKTGGALAISQNGSSRSDIINSGNNVFQYADAAVVNQKSQSTAFTQVDKYTIAQTGAITLDLSRITSAINGNSSQSQNSDQGDKIFSGSFVININGSSNKPLVESRSEFTDSSKFFGSSYYFTALGLNGDQFLNQINQITNKQNRILGDSFVESKLIKDQLRSLTNNSLFLSDETDGDAEIKSLLDNSIAELGRLNLNITDVALKGLTKEQANSLQKDIITFEATEMNGMSIIVPKIYLSLDTRNKLLNSSDGSLALGSTIFAKGDLTINASGSDLTNNGSIISGKNMTLNLASLTNKSALSSSAQAQIKAGNNLSITAINDIKNIGANNNLSKITSGNDLTLSALNGTLLNSSSKINSIGNLTISAGNIKNYLSDISSGNNLNISTIGDIKNIGSSINAGNNINLISTGGNILNTALAQTNDANLLASNPDSYQLAAGDYARSGGNISSSLLASSSISGKNINIEAASDFNNLAAGINAENLTISAGDDINISTLQLRNRTEEHWGGRKRGGVNITDVTTNIASAINSLGSITLISDASAADSETSGNLRGSNVAITGSNLTAADNITIAAKDDVLIQAAQNTSYHESQSWKKGATVAKSSVSGSESTTNVLSTLTSTSGNILLTSGSDTNIIGAKLKADDVAINVGDEVNIYSVSDKNSSWASSSKSRNFSSLITPMAAGLVLSPNATLLRSAAVIVAGDSVNNSSKSSSDSKEKTSNLASVIEASGNVEIASNQDLTISGSDISGKNGNIVSNQGDVNILSAIETEKTSSSSKSTSRETNAPGLKGSKKSSDGTSETVTNVASNLTFTDSLAIDTNGNSSGLNQESNINIKGSNLTVSDGDLTLASAGKITVENAVDSTLNESSSKKRNENIKSISQATDYVEHAVAANLNANNINIQSLGDTTIQGSNVNAKNNLIVGSFTIAQNDDGSYKKDTNGNYVTVDGSTVDNLIIKNADLKEYHYAQSGRGYVGVAGAAMRAAPYALMPIVVLNDLAQKELAIILPDSLEDTFMKYHPVGLAMKEIDKIGTEVGNIKVSESSETRTDRSTVFASNINVGGSMMTNSVNDTTITGSNLNIGGNLLANSLGNFTINAAANTESTTSQTSYETAGKFHSDLNVKRVNYRAGTTKEFVESGNEFAATTLTQSNVNVAGSTLINSSEDFALLASNLITTGSTEINSKNNLNISDGQNKQSTSSYLDNLTIDTGIQIGNAYADAAYAVVDALEAAKKVKEAKDKLEKIESLHDQDMASSKAVERAKQQLVLALINSGLSAAAAYQAVGNAGQAASTSLGTGFYGSVYADITKLKSTTTSEYAQSIASNLISGDAISLTSGMGDINVTGSNISSTNGDLNLTAMLGSVNIKAGESTYSQDSKSNSRNLGGSAGTNGWSANIGFSQSESSLDQTTFTNSQLLAENGTLKINSKEDTNIIGANLLAENIILNTQGNLLVKSKQNLLESDFYSIGASLGISGGQTAVTPPAAGAPTPTPSSATYRNPMSGGVGGGSVGFNTASGFQSRAWVDQVTSIIGTNSVTINTGNNTDIIGAEIANVKNGIDYGNLVLNTKSLTYSDLQNFNNSESNSFGINLSAGRNPNNPTANGSLALSLNMQGSESSSDTKATVGKGTINVNGMDTDSGINRDITQIEVNKKDMITSDFNADLKIDLRLIAAAGNLAVGNREGASANWNSYADETTRGANYANLLIKKPLQTGLEMLLDDKENTFGQFTKTALGQTIITTKLFANMNITANQFAGKDVALIAYEGDSLNDNSDAKGANAFYDQNDSIAALNSSKTKNMSDTEIASLIGHEAIGHKVGGSDEVIAEYLEQHTKDIWNTFQSGNTNFRVSLPTSTDNSNNYANGVVFGELVNPKIDWGNYVLQNPKVKENVEALNQSLVNAGHPDESFVIKITGGDRYRDPNDPNIIRSRTTGRIEKDSAKNSPHLESNGARAVDFGYFGITRDDALKARSNTDFANGYFSDDYKQRPHMHVTLPDLPEFNLKK